LVSVKIKGGNTMFEGLLQPMHLILILIIVLIIFGPGKLPELGSSIGKAIRGFKQAMNEPEKKSEEEAKKIENKDKE
jgi:sec-independent protein translocase protein TatA